jgi:uncharacterized protein (TIGR01244 family)
MFASAGAAEEVAVKSITASLVVALVSGPALWVAAEGIPESVEPALIVNYRVVRPGLATAGKLSTEGLARLKSFGFKTVINLRTEQEGAKDEESAVKGLGLRYEWTPVTPESLSLEDVKKVEQVLADAGAAPVLLHCASANRVGAIWALMQVRRGKTLAEAEAEGRQIGLSAPALIEAVHRLAAQTEAKPSR